MDRLEQIPATGPKQRLLKGDVLAYLGLIAPRDPPVPAGVQGPPPRKLGLPPKADGAQLVVDRLAKAKREHLPQYQRQVAVDQVNELIKQLKQKRGIALTLEDLVLRAATMALQHASDAIDTTIEVAMPTTSAPLAIHSQIKLGGIEQASKLRQALASSSSSSSSSSSLPFLGVGPMQTVTVDPLAPPPAKPLSTDELYAFLLNDELPSKKAVESAETAAATASSPSSSLLDYLLDTTGQVASPSIRQEFPHKEQRITLTIVASPGLKAAAAHQLLDSVASYLEQPQMLQHA
ncbi:hypothetical protein SYNPS1DRAFT_27333 [Syncephalis pseudoplumigaleata]|uniref:Peripheral subunit-binding (PSBD) domain-containing protein n=1 Tax=Syncephalis pseudoplumigaleata TaxID=1712513 RepID=A0A4P9Z3N1_9FUNG|nr:hypothetical protein SYNPS1DRAFT_27333 [Syncephalis pseudoplumigaleata]|eukprot:RKP26998.1 hypothetical protein SYNPS1DRAFT_27333 [Syncephalis pseudoplumigaleata]